jgi:Zn-dependent protease
MVSARLIKHLRHALLWLIPPVAVGIAYPFLKGDAQYLKVMSTTLYLFVLFLSIVAHEVSHGLAAYWCGDATAKEARRLTLNPVNHVSVVGSIIVPLALYLLRTPALLGWAKPVPLNPMRLREYPRDQIFSVLAGPLCNYLLAMVSFYLYLVALLILKSHHPSEVPASLLDPFTVASPQGIRLEGLWFVCLQTLRLGVFVNISLGTFNLFPIPPLDGSWLLRSLLPKGAIPLYSKLQLAGFILIIVALQSKVLGMVLFYPLVGQMMGLQALANLVVGTGT